MRKDLIDAYLVDMGDRLPIIIAAGRDSDLDALAFQAHALKSASAMIGLVALSDTASDVELCAQTAHDLVDTARQSARLVTACNQAVESLGQALGPKPAHGAVPDRPAL